MNQSVLQNQGLLKLTDKHYEYIKQLILYVVKEEKIASSNEDTKSIIVYQKMKEVLEDALQSEIISYQTRNTINDIINEHNQELDKKRKQREQERLDSLDDITWAM